MSTQIEALGGVDQKLKQALREGAARLERSDRELRRSDRKPWRRPAKRRPNAPNRRGQEKKAEKERRKAEEPKTTPTKQEPPTTTPTDDHPGRTPQCRRAKAAEPGAPRAASARPPRSSGRQMMASGTLSGRYEIGDRLGSGGMSNVYQATDLILERTVAVKILAEHLSDDERFVARFRREALAVAKLIHPNIVQVYDTGIDEGRHYIVMEYVEGRSGAQILQRQGPLDGETTAEIGDPGLRRARLRPPPRDHPPRRQAGQPDDRRRPGRRRRDDGEADRLRHRAGDRTDPDHPGRLGGRHRRLPLARAGARRGGDAGNRRLRARRRPLPVPHRAAAV